ncbi:hypothetical protein DLR41_25800 [Salmonella enterica subsp. enterica serovar Panama]|nr:hypothetical protein [Salmonella enterica subsp. enterica serovar Panama]
MRLTSRKKEILSYFEPDNREWVVVWLAGGVADDSSPCGVFRRFCFCMGLRSGGWCRVWFMRPAGGSCVSLCLPVLEKVEVKS